MRASAPEAAFMVQLRALSLPYVSEYQFAKDIGRRWRFDFAFVPQRVAVEIEGGVWTGGRHTRGAGFQKDTEKYAEALVRGWRVLRVTPGQIRSGQALAWIEVLLSRVA